MKTSTFLQSYKEIFAKESLTGLLDYPKNDGFDAVEAVYEFGVGNDKALEASKILGNAIEEKGLKCSCLSRGYWMLNVPREQTLKELKDCVDMAVNLKTPYLHHVLQMSLSLKKLPLYKKHHKTFVELCREVAYYAGEKGISCIYEDQGYLQNTPERLGDLLTDIDLPNVGICLDVGNSLFYDIDAETYAGFFASYIKHVHVKDYIRKPIESVVPNGQWLYSISGQALRDTIIGHGVVNFERIFSILILAGYDGYFSLENGAPEKTAEAVQEGLRNMKIFYDRAYNNLVAAGKIKPNS